MSDIGLPLEISRPLLQMLGNEGRNGFRFIGRKAVIAAGDNMQPGIRHAAFEMEPNANRADRIGVPPNQKRRCVDQLNSKFRSCRTLHDPVGGLWKLTSVVCPPIGGQIASCSRRLK